MIRKMSDERKIAFLESEPEVVVENTRETKQAKTLKQVAEEQKSKKLNNSFDPIMTTQYIGSARTGVISNNSGPTKFMKSEISNTIWDNEKLSKLAPDNKTKTVEAKEKIVTNKRTAEQERMNKLVADIQATEQRKESTVTPVSAFQGSNYKVPEGKMSIFDTQDFQRLPEKTAGEQSSEATQERRIQKDESWKNSGKTVSSKELVRNYFDNLLDHTGKNK